MKKLVYNLLFVCSSGCLQSNHPYKKAPKIIVADRSNGNGKLKENRWLICMVMMHESKSIYNNILNILSINGLNSKHKN